MILARRSFVVLVLVAVLGILGQWSGAVDAHLWRIPAAAWIAAVALEGIWMRRFRAPIERDLPDLGYLGRALRSRLHFHNPLHRPLEVELADCHAPGLSPLNAYHRWQLAPGRGVEASATLIPHQLGPLAWDRVDVRILGRFGLAWWHRRMSVPARVQIMPDYLGRDGHQSGSTARGRQRRPSPGDGHELYGLREYRRGDPLRDMDWKATARRGAPVVRIRELDETISLIIAIDAGRSSAMQCGTLSRLGHYVNVASRLGEEALGHGDQVALVSYADTAMATLPPVRGHSGLLRIREYLSLLQPQARDSNPVAAAMSVRQLAAHRSLVVLMTDLDEGRAGAHLLHAARLLVPRHLPLIGALTDSDLLAMRWHGDGDWRAPFNMLAALELTRDARRTRAHLERAGAHVVQAPAERLDERIRRTYALLRGRHRV